MKKITALLLALAMILSLAACSSENQTTAAESSAEQTTEAETKQSEEASTQEPATEAETTPAETEPESPQKEAELPAVGDKVEGFVVKEIRDFPLFGASLVYFEHEATGARLM